MRDYEELVNSLKNCVYIPCDGAQKEKCMAGREDDCRRELMAIAAYAIEELVSNADKPKWISVEERLPEEEKTVLVVRKFLSAKGVTVSVYVETAELIGGDWVSMSDEYKIIRYRHTDPIYWMPLPEPPEGES